MDRLRFGPAGVPLSAPKRDIITGIIHTGALGLDAMELEFVYGVRLKKKIAEKAKRIANEKDIVLTAHAPYYINLNAREQSKIDRSIRMLLDSARILHVAGGWSVVFHPGWYMGKPKEETYRRIKGIIENVVKALGDEGIRIWIRPETMEMEKKFGTVDEVIRLSQDIEMVLPCIDFAHIRYRYHNRSPSFFRSILEKIENKLGKEAIENMHIHISGIRLDPKGSHLNLGQSDIPWQEILQLLKEFGVKGVVISESPNIEDDAIMLKKYWERL
ncbi:MAG TPA: hypothetical protein EYH09_00735 [Candidatus Nanopusillus sp.]|nr:hypothetical protein [Candidatus Nanopusillus sp.]